MAKRKKNKKSSALSNETKSLILGSLLILFGLIILFSFFNLSGVAGEFIRKSFKYLIGRTVFLLPFLLFLAAFGSFISKEKRKKSLFLAGLLFIIGASGLISAIDLKYNVDFSLFLQTNSQGGLLGYILAWPLFRLFGFWVTGIIFLAFLAISSLIFREFLKRFYKPSAEEEQQKSPSFIKRIFAPKFEVKKVESSPIISSPPVLDEMKTEQRVIDKSLLKYFPPPIDLLEASKETPASGDLKVNSSIIKKTLQNFNIDVAISEVNIGPTVTQYALKPSEGVKLSKITALSNDLALALAAHPLRIEAPIPGRSLVGIEVPNKKRARVKLRELIEHSQFQNSSTGLPIALGKDVSGNPMYSDISRMPHLLVAGSTGTGKTIFLNTLIVSLLYKNSPEALRLILIDPKRVEFSIYKGLPHLLSPIIYNVDKTINALRWLITEMERRFDLLSANHSRDIIRYNNTKSERLPYIVLIIDELADLMVTKGRDIEAASVRLAQMARAVGIHLVMATQRPSVEVITGLIKANITTRATFQVASQIDSRTVLDAAGAEKLLGAGDMLFLSAEASKPKRIQGPYISEKETKKIVEYIESKNKVEDQEDVLSKDLAERLEAQTQEIKFSGRDFEEDPLYERAKEIVEEAKKASASLLQRRLRVGYARAARLLDILEERGVVGPADGAKPREIYTQPEESSSEEEFKPI